MHFLTKHLLLYAEAQGETRDVSDRNPLVKSKGKSNIGHTAVGTYDTPPAQGDEVDKAIYKQPPKATQFLALVRIRDFNCVSTMALCKQSRIFLACICDNFLMQMLDRQNKGNTLCDLCAQTGKNKRQMWPQIGSSDHKLIAFRIQKTGKESRRIRTQNFMQVDFGLFRKKLSRISQEVEAEGAKDSW